MVCAFCIDFLKYLVHISDILMAPKKFFFQKNLLPYLISIDSDICLIMMGSVEFNAPLKKMIFKTCCSALVSLQTCRMFH